MKFTSKISSTLLFLLVLCTIMFCLSSCNNSHVKTGEDFKKLAQQEGFIVVDNTQFNTHTKGLKEELRSSTQQGCDMDFYTFDSEENAKKYFDEERNFNRINNTQKEENGFSIKIEDVSVYSHVTLYKNTILHGYGQSYQKEQIEEFFKKFEYK